MTFRHTPANSPQMFLAVDYVREHPGCSILPVAEYVGPHGSRRYGYAIVHRAIDAGLIYGEPTGPRGSYELYDLEAVGRLEVLNVA